MYLFSSALSSSPLSATTIALPVWNSTRVGVVQCCVSDGRSSRVRSSIRVTVIGSMRMRSVDPIGRAGTSAPATMRLIRM